MRVGSHRGQLYDAQKTARGRWDTTQDAWNDSARAEFAEQVWEPLDHSVSEVLQAVDQLAALFAQVRQDCEFT